MTTSTRPLEDPLPDPEPGLESLTGLSSAEAEMRLRRGDGNRAVSVSSRSYLTILRTNVFNLYNSILFGIGAALLAFGRYSDAVISVSIGLLNAVISSVQEIRAKRQLDRLQMLGRDTVWVVRDGHDTEIAPEDVVRGDMVRVRPGSQVVVDGPVVAGVVEVDESLLTGESDAQLRATGESLLSGSHCVGGGGLQLARDVGASSYANRLTDAARRDSTDTTPLQREVAFCVRLVMVLVALMTGAILLQAALDGLSLVRVVQISAVLSGLVPYGLFFLIVVAYTAGAVASSRRGALVQRVNAVESLSNVDVLCTDKTGTLTTGRLSVTEVVPLTGHDARAVETALGSMARSAVVANLTSTALAAHLPGAAAPTLEEVPLGVGTNIQARAVHLVDMDAPWRPADVEQRHGRILRQGNQNPEVRISQVVTVGSFDTYMWQTLERKARFIGQVMAGKVTDRETGDIGTDELQYAEVKALSSGNPMLLEMAQAEQDLSRYRRLERAHHTNQRNLQTTATVSARNLAAVRDKIPALQHAVGRTVSTKGDDFTMRVDGATYRKRTDAAAALDRWAHQYGRFRIGAAAEHGPVVEVGGHQINVSTDGETLSWALAAVPDLRIVNPLTDIINSRVDIGQITRLENLPGRITGSLANCQVQAQDLEQRIRQAEAGQGKPFRYTDELAAAEARYSELSAAITATRDEPALVPAAAAPSVAEYVSASLAKTRATLSGINNLLVEPKPAGRERPERAPQLKPDRGLNRD